MVRGIGKLRGGTQILRCAAVLPLVPELHPPRYVHLASIQRLFWKDCQLLNTWKRMPTLPIYARI